jgi:hypothetical protein
MRDECCLNIFVQPSFKRVCFLKKLTPIARLAVFESTGFEIELFLAGSAVFRTRLNQAFLGGYLPDLPRLAFARAVV